MWSVISQSHGRWKSLCRTVFNRYCSLASAIPQQKVKVKDVDINFTTMGNGPYHVLFMPGVFGSIESDFGTILPKLDTKLVTAHSWDPPGYGKSRPPSRAVACANNGNPFLFDAEYATELMKVLNVPKYSIVGWSYGGVTGTIMAAKHPEHVEKLICLGSRTKIDKLGLFMHESLKDPSKWTPDRWMWAERVYGKEYALEMANILYDFTERIFRKDGFPLLPYLKAVKAPTLFIQPKYDLQAPLIHGETFKRFVPNCRLHIWEEEDAGHDLHLQYPEKFVEIVQKFLCYGTSKI